ncbi:MAG: hypothetical protein QOJ41_3119 [Acidobacteriaceae bacterium]|jgi:hypothetical protein|nr:hypothetical protein [Acidobacteriaceae bacterium]
MLGQSQVGNVSENLSLHVSAKRGGGLASVDAGFHVEVFHVARGLEKRTAAIRTRTAFGPVATVSTRYKISTTAAA